MRAALSYSLSRVLLFAAAFGVFRLLGARGFLLLALAFGVSGLISFVLLSRQRDAMSGSLAARVREFRQRIDEGSQAEDRD